MAKTLKQLFIERCSLEDARKETFQETCIIVVKQWLTQKRQEEMQQQEHYKFCLSLRGLSVLDELLEELK